MSGTLYLIPVFLGESTPWLEVLPAATRETACHLKHFVAENAKTARAALKWLEHPMPIRDIAIEQLPEKPSLTDVERLLAPLLSDHDVGLMSEAGCPGVADPGALLVRRAHELDIQVRPMIGPSSLLLALMASGLDGQRFAFHGYIPAREPERSKRITELEKESRHKQQTQLLIETPYRNTALFDALLAACQPQTLLCVASDLSLQNESVITRSVKQWRAAVKPLLDRRPTVFLLLA